MKNRASGDLPDIECACAALRRAARLITQLYDEEFRPESNASQLALLKMLDRLPGSSQANLARALGFDKTTLSRNLKVLERNGWIEHGAGEDQRAQDQRERGFHLTAGGRKLLAESAPGWRRAQNRLQSSMTAEQWDAMWTVIRTVTNAANEARSGKARFRTKTTGQQRE